MTKNWQQLKNKQKSWESFFVKQHLFRLIRDFFWSQNFMEVDLPILNPGYPIEPNIFLSPVTWQHKNKTFYLPPSPESSIKKLIAAGLDNCFTISKCVRDLEDLGPTHNLEFNMLEWYEIGKNYKQVAQTTKQLFSYLIEKLDFQSPVNFTNWHQTSVKELFQTHAHIDLDENSDFASIEKTAKAKGYNTQGITTWEPLYNQIWINEIEPNLPQNQPVLVFDFPERISTLCQPSPNPLYGQRWELYINGLEFANCYTELCNPDQQTQNFTRETNDRLSLNQPIHPQDSDFIDSLSSLPSCSGIAIGLERLAMFFAHTKDINDVIFFPTSEMI